MKIGKTEFVEQVAQKTGLLKKDADVAVNAFLDVVTDNLAEGNEILFVGFGKFLVRENAERLGRNPQTGETMVIPPHKAPAFKAGTTLKDAVK